MHFAHIVLHEYVLADKALLCTELCYTLRRRDLGLAQIFRALAL